MFLCWVFVLKLESGGCASDRGTGDTWKTGDMGVKGETGDTWKKEDTGVKKRAHGTQGSLKT